MLRRSGSCDVDLSFKLVPTSLSSVVEYFHADSNLLFITLTTATNNTGCKMRVGELSKFNFRSLVPQNNANKVSILV